MITDTFENAYPGLLVADAESMPAALYLVWKYHDDFDAGILANAMVGGDNCHRGAVVGPLLGAANGVPSKWLENKAQ